MPVVSESILSPFPFIVKQVLVWTINDCIHFVDEELRLGALPKCPQLVRGRSGFTLALFGI